MSSVVSIIQTYLVVAILVSTAIGLLGLPRYYQERDSEELEAKKVCESIRSIFWDIIIQIIGFLLLATFIGCVIIIWFGGDITRELVCLLLSIFSMVCAIFCLSGRGVEVLSAKIKTLTTLHLGRNGIDAKFNESSSQ
jgi:hypothetical protein